METTTQTAQVLPLFSCELSVSPIPRTPLTNGRSADPPFEGSAQEKLSFLKAFWVKLGLTVLHKNSPSGSDPKTHLSQSQNEEKSIRKSMKGRNILRC